MTTTTASGEYSFDAVAPGTYQVLFALPNFAPLRQRGLNVETGADTRVDALLHLAFHADVTVTGKRTFTNLAVAEDPAQDLVGIAESASQGAITARQLEARPLMRVGEVLETVPGVIISQHSGEGKANQYYLRGFNLDHGTDFASTVAGVPINLPTHAHGQGYSDLNFVIPELISGVQFSKGPYFADHGDFSAAGSVNINYVNVLDHAVARASSGGQGFDRILFAVSPRVIGGHLLTAVELEHADGPWTHPDGAQKLNGVLRYTQGDTVNGFSLTGTAYHARWRSTDQIPRRAVDRGLLGRFGTIDPTDGGHTYRYSLAGDWQRGSGSFLTKIAAYGVASDLDLFSNFTYFLSDPDHGDQIEQTDHRYVTGVNVSTRQLTRWAGREVENTIGIQVRNDDVATIGLFHTQDRIRLETRSQDSVEETSGGLYGQNAVEWTPWLRTMVGLRADAYRFSVAALEAQNGGTRTAGLISPKGGVTVGPWHGTEFYVNGGYGYHSNDARGTTITRDANGNLVERVTPLARAKGAELGMRTVTIPHLQTTLAIWRLGMASELVFAGDAGTTEVGRPSLRHGIEWTNYYTPRSWLMLDADVSWSHARFTDVSPLGDRIPGSVQTVMSLGATVDDFHRIFGSARLRYFGPRPLIANGSVESKATRLVNLGAGYQLTRRVRVGLDVFNVLNARDSDIDYYYASRLAGEPLNGVNDIHFHPTLPRTARVSLLLTF